MVEYFVAYAEPIVTCGEARLSVRRPARAPANGGHTIDFRRVAARSVTPLEDRRDASPYPRLLARSLGVPPPSGPLESPEPVAISSRPVPAAAGVWSSSRPSNGRGNRARHITPPHQPGAALRDQPRLPLTSRRTPPLRGMRQNALFSTTRLNMSRGQLPIHGPPHQVPADPSAEPVSPSSQTSKTRNPH